MNSVALHEVNARLVGQNGRYEGYKGIQAKRKDGTRLFFDMDGAEYSLVAGKILSLNDDPGYVRYGTSESLQVLVWEYEK